MSELIASYKLYDKVILTSSLEELEHYNAILEMRLLDDYKAQNEGDIWG